MIDQASTFNEEIYLVKEKVNIILSEPWENIPEADRQLLQKILQSVRLNLASVRVLYQPQPDASQLTSRTIYFGATEVKTDGMVVHAPQLSQLQTDPAGKQKLWLALKQLFGL
ncbi:MAG TPA: DNA polymerase III subunit psi [Cyclobacteriaceae bacterium]